MWHHAPRVNDDANSPKGRVRVLSFHAGYACASTGACCSAGWPIPVEGHVLPVLRRAIDDGRVTTVSGSSPLTFPDARPDDVGAVLGRTPAGTCVFFDRAQPGGCCRVQRHAGLPAMPIACRQFPRIVRRDSAGTDISLSHWCPTALATLGDVAEPARIVDATGSPVAEAAIEGLDARETWPPLLRADCLADREAYDAIEAATVDALANGGGSVHARLGRVVTLYERLRAWRPSCGVQPAFVVDAIRRWEDGGGEAITAPAPGLEERARTAFVDAVLDAVPPGERWRVPGRPGVPAAEARAVLDEPLARGRLGRYLAARAFGAWMAYQGRGLRTVAAYLAAALATVEAWLPVSASAAAVDGLTPDPSDARVAAAIRTADLLLLHLGSPEHLARRLSDWERAPLPFTASG
jgi:Fe-S-cluster containining protein